MTLSNQTAVNESQIHSNLGEDTVVEDGLLNYLSHYGLENDPFQLTGFLAIGDHQNQLDLLSHLAHFSELLICLSGPEESGKTTLLNALSAEQDEFTQVIQITADPLMGRQQLLSDIAVRLGLNATGYDSASLVSLIRIQASHSADEGEEILLLIDDGEYLEPAALKSLVSLVTPSVVSENGKPIHIVIAGNEGLEDNLHVLEARKSPDDKQVHFQHLTPLTLGEIQDYIEQFFQRAGAKGPLPLSSDELEEIHLRSDGWPGKINRSTQDLLLEGLGEPVADIHSSFPVYHVLGIAFISLLLIATWMLTGSPESPELASSSGSVNEATTTTNDDQGFNPFKVETNGQENKVSNQSTDSKPAKQEVKKVTGPLSNETASNQAANSSNEGKGNENSNLSTGPSSDTSIDERLKRAEDQLRKELVQPKAIETKAIESKENDPIGEFAKQNKAATSIDRSNATALKKDQKTLALKKSPKVIYANRMLGKDANNFCVQLLGTRERKSAEEFIAGYERRLSGSFSYFETAYKGQSWYVVVYGNFPTRQKALEAIPTLPIELRRQKPWVRSFKSIRSNLINNS